MFTNLFKNLLGEGKVLRRYVERVERINALEHEIEVYSNEELTQKAKALKHEKRGEERVNYAFALVREAAKRTLGQRHYDVQLIGGLVLCEGAIAEMATGEGKTLVATLPAFTRALEHSVHVVTVNDYLARRDAVWMGQVYDCLGLSTSCITSEGSFIYDPSHVVEGERNALDTARDVEGNFRVVQNYLRPITRREAYSANVVYGTNTEFGFDYLRDNLVYAAAEKTQQGHHFAIVDEIDSILIDEARTPLIISAPQAESSDLYREMAQVVKNLREEDDYVIDRKLRSATFTEAGISKVEKILRLPNVYDPAGFRYLHYLEAALKARALYHKDKEYVIKDGEVIIVDEFTGRMLPGRRYTGGLHQAIEAKEHVAIKQESKTMASVTIQNYFRLYATLSGMTGTAKTSAEEFHKVYGLDVISIPTNRPLARKDQPDFMYQTKNAKWVAVIEEIKKRSAAGQPVLVGTTSIENNEIVSILLSHEGIRHEVLNAKQHEKEGGVIAQAGKSGAVTVATNMAGRGVDIVLGGNPVDREEAGHVRAAGGLYVIGTDKHESRRIDNQLRGRSGRQGDPGESRFFISLEDDLIKTFGGEKMKTLMQRMNVPESMPIESPLVSRMMESAQSKVEGMYFDMRKRTLEYDDVVNKQRTAVYRTRDELLLLPDTDVSARYQQMVHEALSQLIALETEGPSSAWNLGELLMMCKTNLIIHDTARVEEMIAAHRETYGDNNDDTLRNELTEHLQNALTEACATHHVDDREPQVLRSFMTSVLDQLWMEQLETLDDLKESVQLRAHGQHDPIVEFKNEAHRYFKGLFFVWKRNCLWYFKTIAGVKE
ncbi:MAG: preprotein translocase subunit SecA [Patescibacteria group bacterium]|nr:preprotein translocase subunit SecA [Patescibacteria group bacterium]MDE2437783.1 preprotein translocase subunit SecA [Patescibacteria group bacterium]